jgi:hypothetical protein
MAYSDTSVPQYHQFIGDTEIMKTKLEAWKYCLRKTKRQLPAQRLDQLSRSTSTLSDVTKVIESGKLWGFYERAMRKTRAGEDVGHMDLKMATGACAVTLLYTNWQRQDINLTVEEFASGMGQRWCLSNTTRQGPWDKPRYVLRSRSSIN